jgi:hypothetical protein
MLKDASSTPRYQLHVSSKPELVLNMDDYVDAPSRTGITFRTTWLLAALRTQVITAPISCCQVSFPIYRERIEVWHAQ